MPGSPALSAPYFGKGSVEVLYQTARRLGKEAAAHPGNFLPAYQAMQRILQAADPAGGIIRKEDLQLVQQAIMKLLPVAGASPAGQKGERATGLSDIYFRDLHKTDRGR